MGFAHKCFGFLMATLGLKLRVENASHLSAWLAPVLILGVAIFDTTLVTISLRAGDFCLLLRRARTTPRTASQSQPRPSGRRDHPVASGCGRRLRCFVCESHFHALWCAEGAGGLFTSDPAKLGSAQGSTLFAPTSCFCILTTPLPPIL